MATGASGPAGVTVTRVPPLADERQSSWLGGNASAFHDPGPTAHPKSTRSSLCSSR